MRTTRSALLSLPNFSTLILCTLIFSTLSFAAAPDRIAGPVVSSQLIKLSAGVPLKAQPQYDQGPVDPSFKLNHITLLTVPSASQQKAITQLLAQQQDPRSPQYHKWLTPEQYADRFGLSPNDIQKLTTWLQSQGFSIREVARARNFIVFSGTSAQVECVFQTEIHNFEVDGEKHFSNIASPSIPVALSGVVTGIRGLSNFHLKSHVIHSKPNYTEPVSGGDNFWIAPGDIAAMYDITPLYSAGIYGNGQTLAVMGETDVYLADLNDFRSGFSLPQISGCTLNSNLVITACDTTNFKYVLNGTDTTGLPDSVQQGDLIEADTDIEWSGAVAQQAQIIYVNSPDPNGNGVWDSWYYAVDNKVSPVITLSYGGCEFSEALYSAEDPGLRGTFGLDEPELKMANAEGITFMNSSGDNGAAECDPTETDPNDTLATGGMAVSYPASSPEVTGVGGTLIPYPDYTPTYWNSSNGSTGGSATGYIPEQGWNDAQEWGEACVDDPSVYGSFCTANGITSWATAQSFFDISAGGGGASNCYTISNGVCTGGFPQPTWQANLAIPGQTTKVRFSPDVSLIAAVFWPGIIVCTPVNEVLGNGDTASMCANGIAGFFSYGYTFGGTSFATPMFAGIVTLLNQYLGNSGTGLGNINTILYSLAATPANGAFHPVEVGSNGVYCEPGTPAVVGWPAALQCPSSGANAGFFGFDASNFDPTTGYNLVTGLGSVDANKLAKAWASATTNFTLTPTTGAFTVAPGVTAGPDTITVTSTSGFVTNGQTAESLTYSCSGLPSEATCVFSPTSPTSSATVTVSITTTAPTAQLRAPLGHGNRIFYAMLLPGLVGIFLTVGSRKRAARGVRLLSFIVVLGLSTMWLVTCGGGSGGGGSRSLSGIDSPGAPNITVFPEGTSA
jgi:subtilase family serine protease